MVCMFAQEDGEGDGGDEGGGGEAEEEFDAAVCALIDSDRLREYYLESHPHSFHHLRREPMRRVSCVALFLGGGRLVRALPFKLELRPGGELPFELLQGHARGLAARFAGFALAEALLFNVSEVDKAALPAFAACVFSRAPEAAQPLDPGFWTPLSPDGKDKKDALRLRPSLPIFHRSNRLYLLFTSQI